MAVRISKYLSEHNLYEPLQSVYREHHRTETVLLRVQNDILRTLDERQGVYLVLLDLSAAFDTIDHEILISRLRDNVGITDLALAWIRSYLSERVQTVSIKGHSSEEVNLIYGVPQGSVLGPKFFVIYAAHCSDMQGAWPKCPFIR